MDKFRKDYNRDENAGSSKKNLSVREKAEEYVKGIEKLLVMEEATAADIKQCIGKVDKMVEDNIGISAHQVRNIFALVNGINISDKNALIELQKIRPKLAYIGARMANARKHEEEQGKVIVAVLDDLIKLIDVSDDETLAKNKIKGLQFVMESIVAYHKFHSKKNS